MENLTGMIGVDKMGAEILFLDPKSYEVDKTLKGFQRTVHELLVVPQRGTAYVPIFGHGTPGHNPNHRHVVCVIDLNNRTHAADIALRHYIPQNTLKLRPNRFIDITCENSAVVAVIDQTTNTDVDAID